MRTKVAIPKLDSVVAPQFETAASFLLCRVGEGDRSDCQVADCAGCEGFGRVRLLRDREIDTLVCNGIKGFYRNLLESLGVWVIDGVSLPVEEALDRFAAGAWSHRSRQRNAAGEICEIPHDDIVCWTKELFQSHGWEVFSAEGKAPFPVDLVGQIACPICGKPVRVAICCGAHIYRSDQEVREFHLCAPATYHAQVYVHPGSPALQESCRAFGIQLIDPNSEKANRDEKVAGGVAPLAGPIAGHDGIVTDNRT